MENKQIERYNSQRGNKLPTRLNATDNEEVDNYILSRKQIRERLDNKKQAEWDKQQKENLINECANETIQRAEKQIVKFIDDILKS